MKASSKKRPAPAGLPKAPTGIQGLDEITLGGLPRGRTTLICGSAGCGKTLMAMEFLVRGANHGEPGVFMAFEETPAELVQNVRSLGFDLDRLCADGKLAMDHIRIERSEIEETGEYDLEGLFVRLAYAIDAVGARRVVLDTIETIFAGFRNEGLLRSELRRLFRWLNERGVTAIVTGERGEGMLTRHGIEEYVSDCVILLEHRVVDEISTRRLRIVKYRGTTHGTNQYPFLIDPDGIQILPLTSLGLRHTVSAERVSSGIPGLDAMLGGGYYRGSTVLVSGTAGSGKSSIAAHFARAACRQGERCLYFSFEESPDQILRNMRSIGVDLAPHLKKDLLRIHSIRSVMHGLEMHLVIFHKLVREFRPQAVIVDPVGTLMQAGSRQDTRSMLVRLMDFLKEQQVTAILTDLTSGDQALERTQVEISSLVDTWLLLRDIELGGERNRAMYILKSRGMAHSNQIREFVLSDRGIELREVYVGPEGVLTGSMRVAQEARERAQALQRRQAVDTHRRELARKRADLEARIAEMRRDFEQEAAELEQVLGQQGLQEEAIQEDRERMRVSRKGANSGAAARPRSGRAAPTGKRP